jgi:hypothetical protein
MLTVETAGYLAIAAVVLAALALLLAIWLLFRTRRLMRLGAYRPQTPATLQQTVEDEMRRVDVLTSRVQNIGDRLPITENRAALAVQRVGIVRFNPFEDTGGQQSFALALLDSRGSGLVISSLHSRQATRVYLKQLLDGRSDTQLSDEESEAIRRALAGETSDAAARSSTARS